MSALFFLAPLLVLVIAFLLLAHEFFTPVIIFPSTSFFVLVFLSLPLALIFLFFEVPLLVPVVVLPFLVHEFLVPVVAVRSHGRRRRPAKSGARPWVGAPDDSYQDDHDNDEH